MTAHRLPPPSPAVAGMTPYHVPRHPAPLDLLLDGIGGLTPPPDLFRALDDAGGDDALDRLCRAWLAPGRSIVLPVPTFEMIPRYAA